MENTAVNSVWANCPRKMLLNYLSANCPTKTLLNLYSVRTSKA